MLVGCLLLGAIALSAVGNTMRERRKSRAISREAASQSSSMRELIRTVRLAESMAGIGVWQYVPATGAQEWSDGVKHLFGMDRTAPLVDGDAEAMLYANGSDLIDRVEDHLDEIEPYRLQLEIAGFDGVSRVLEFQACNMRGAGGIVQRVVAIVRDVTGQDDATKQDDTGGHRSDHETVRRAHNHLSLAPNIGLATGARPSPSAEHGRDARDPLTGLFTRRAAMQRLDVLVIEARAQQMPLSLVMFDIDHLKRINNQHGRDDGDAVLRKVARVAREQARIGDPIGRIGGEEFVWIIPGVCERTVRLMTERMRQAIAKGSAVGHIGPVTISLGFAVMQPDDTPLGLFARADRALIEAMHSGHNRVRCAA